MLSIVIAPFVVILAVAFLGSFIQAASGFGYAIMFMSIVPMFLPFKTASIVEVITAFILTILITGKLWKYINFRILITPLIFLSIGSTIGVSILFSNSDILLRRFLGVVLIVLSFYMIFFNDRIKIRPTLINGMIAGFVSGFLGGVCNISGPPMVIYLLSVTKDKEEYISTLQFLNVCNCIFVLLLHFIRGNVNTTVINYSAAAAFGVFAGTFLGLKLFMKMSPSGLKKLVYVFMVVMGFYLLIFG